MEGFAACSRFDVGLRGLSQQAHALIVVAAVEATNRAAAYANTAGAETITAAAAALAAAAGVTSHTLPRHM